MIRRALYLAAALSISIGTCSCTPSDSRPNVASARPAGVLDYEVLRDESSDSGTARKLIRRHILLHGDLTKDSITTTLTSIHDSERAATREGVALWQISIFAYGDRAHFEDGSAHWVGMMDADNDDPPNIQINDVLLHPPAATTKFGLTEQKRKDIYFEIVAAQDRAEKESNAAHPDPNDFRAQFDMQNSLSEKYERSVRRKHRISEDIETKIKAEGATSQWTMPKSAD